MRHCRREATGTYQWYTAADKLPDDWNCGLPPNHYLQKESLRAHEAGNIPNVQVLYVSVLVNNRVVMRAAFQVLAVKDRHINSVSLKSWQYRLWKAFTGLARPKLLVAGQLFRHDIATVYWDGGLTLFEAFIHYRDVIDAAGRTASAAAVLVKDCPEALAPLFQHQAPEYLLLRNDISMEMAVDESWTSMVHYEKSLKHKYAQRYRNVRKRIEHVSIKEFSHEDVVKHADELYALYLEVTENQPVRLGILSKGFLPLLKSYYGNALRVWGFYEGERLIAFASGFVHSDSFDMFYIGFDYKRNVELQLYFNILFFAIEQAISLKREKLILGRTALEAKARIGCTPKYLYSFLYIRNAALRRVVRGLQNKFSEGAEWEERHPFKA